MDETATMNVNQPGSDDGKPHMCGCLCLVHKQTTLLGMGQTGEASSPLRQGVLCPNAFSVIALALDLALRGAGRVRLDTNLRSNVQ